MHHTIMETRFGRYNSSIRTHNRRLPLFDLSSFQLLGSFALCQCTSLFHRVIGNSAHSPLSAFYIRTTFPSSFPVHFHLLCANCSLSLRLFLRCDVIFTPWLIGHRRLLHRFRISFSAQLDCRRSFFHCQFCTSRSSTSSIFRRIFRCSLHLVPSIGIGILRTVICQICNFFFRADICLLHAFSCNRRLIQCLNTMYLFSGLNLWHFPAHLHTQKRGRITPARVQIDPHQVGSSSAHTVSYSEENG